jgi:hypothetical protein
MWSLLLTTLNHVSFANSWQGYQDSPYQKTAISHLLSQVNSKPDSVDLPQTINQVEIVSPLGYSLKHPSTWQRFSTPNSSPDSDIFLSKSFPSSATDNVITVTTTLREFLSVPKQLPPNVQRFDRVAELYASLLYRIGYKIYELKPLMINQRKAIALVTETPDKKGSTTVLIEGKDEKMVVSTAVYPLDNSIMTRETLEQALAEIREIQNSITIR